MAGLLEKSAANVTSSPSSVSNFMSHHSLVPVSSTSWGPSAHHTEHSLSTSSQCNGQRHLLPLTCCRIRGSGARDRPSLLATEIHREMNTFVVRSNNGVVRERPDVLEDGADYDQRTAVVWFKQDLRIDDHPGLAAATEYRNVLPVYVFDPQRLAGWSADLVEELRDAVIDLRKSLRNIDSDLIIKFGKTEDVLCALASEADVTDIITEEEVEMEWDQLVHSVSTSLSNGGAGKAPQIKSWRNSVYEIEGLQEFPECYKTFQKQKYSVTNPLDPPKSLPVLPRTFDVGSVPSVVEISNAIAAVNHSSPEWNNIRFAHRAPAEELLGAMASEVKTKSDKGFRTSTRVQPSAAISVANLGRGKENGTLGSEYFEEKEDYVIKGGANGALKVLKGYLTVLESNHSTEWQELHLHIRSLEKRPGASFRAIFGRALALGTLSLRRVYHAAAKLQQARRGGWMYGFRMLRTDLAAIRDLKAIEWYRLLALKSREQGREQGFQVGTWRWRGYLVQYALAGDVGPPVVFVHGFGAFWQHWRDNIKGVAESGHRVFALTMLGFGRSEKPLITYTDLVWGELVRDFILEVVREPVVAAGNSIGGYTVSVVAGLWPSLVKSLVLLNSAGRVVLNYGSVKYNRPREKSAVAYYGARLLLAYLQNLSNGMLTKCYPTNPSRADSWLQGEVMRASYDPNATAVLEAMFHLRAPLPLNYYLDRYGGDILVIQGMRDPLHNSSKRASMLQAFCKNVSIQYVNAGHCPHDEVPADVNSILTTWLRGRESLKSTSGAKTGLASEVEMDKIAVKEVLESPSQEETNGALLPDALVRLKEEVEELV